ncbi:hypothetical protein BJV74DRAFT_795039 [Russula compacta]|nr:hypothetical protein BJV74DRAFT_795039 [Russula compacta]
MSKIGVHGMIVEQEKRRVNAVKRDYAMIEVDDDKIDRTNFKGNVIDLGVYHDDVPQPPEWHLPQNSEPCLMVIKNGSATGVIIGRATGIFSSVRDYFDDDSDQTSKEWSIIPYDTKSGSFSAPGDSGAVIVDGQGRMGGLLTGGTGYPGFLRRHICYAHRLPAEEYQGQSLP